MPELPEVQTVVSDLNKKIKGDKIVDFWSDWPSAIKNATLANFKRAVKNREILGARRIGKNIFIDLSGGKTLYIHLKMTGHLLIKSEILNSKFETSDSKSGKKSKSFKLKAKSYFDDRVNQYVHHAWKLRDKKGNFKALEFSDLRKFGKIISIDTDNVGELPEIKALGIDALDKKFDLKKFNEILDKKSKTPIGLLLMDQSLISGIGNIYRSEILFASRVLPERETGSLKTAERKKIFDNIKKILEKAVKLRGTSDSDYRDTDGAPGGFQKILKVYKREGEKCQKCGTIISRGKMGQRSIFFCPKCQK